MRILHTGDLHLDSAFCAYGARDSQKQREAGRALLRRIFECAKNESCEMILISGDLFDGKFVSPETAELFCTLVENCTVPVVVSPGNHDFYFDGSFYSKAAKRLGDKLTVFTSPELQVFDFDELGVSVFGYAFTSAALTQSPLMTSEVYEDNGKLRILCAHADMSSPTSRYAPISLGQIQRLGFAYSALGHIHNRAPAEDSEGKVRYCGFAQGRSFDEIGEGGVWIVDVTADGVTAERRILSSAAFYRFAVALQGNEADASEKIIDAAREQSYGEGAHLRITLEGISQTTSGTELSALAQRVKEALGVEYVEIEDETLPLLDGEYLERDTTLRGELYRTLKPKLLSGDDAERRRALKALQIGLAAIDGKNIFGFVE